MTGPVVPEKDSRLDQLCAEYTRLRPVVDEKSERLKTVTDGIKAELSAARPGETRVTLVSDRLDSPLKLTAKQSMRLDTKLLKSDEPYLYAKYSKKTISWELRQS